MDSLEEGERVLVTAESPDGGVTATDRRLIWPTGSINWYEVEKATWNGDAETLDVVPVAASEHRQTYRLPITKPGRLVDVVREQVVGSVVISRYVPLDGRRGVRVSGRRKADGSLVWQAVVDAGLDPDDPQLRPHLDAAVRTVRREVE